MLIKNVVNTFCIAIIPENYQGTNNFKIKSTFKISEHVSVDVQLLILQVNLRKYERPYTFDY